MDKVKIGFVGVGTMGQCAHLRNYVTVPGCEVVAIAELRQDLARAVAARYGVSRVYPDHAAMLAQVPQLRKDELYQVVPLLLHVAEGGGDEDANDSRHGRHGRLVRHNNPPSMNPSSPRPGPTWAAARQHLEFYIPTSLRRPGLSISCAAGAFPPRQAQPLDCPDPDRSQGTKRYPKATIALSVSIAALRSYCFSDSGRSAYGTRSGCFLAASSRFGPQVQPSAIRRAAQMSWAFSARRSVSARSSGDSAEWHEDKR